MKTTLLFLVALALLAVTFAGSSGKSCTCTNGECTCTEEYDPNGNSAGASSMSSSVNGRGSSYTGAGTGKGNDFTWQSSQSGDPYFQPNFQPYPSPGSFDPFAWVASRTGGRGGYPGGASAGSYAWGRKKK